MATPGTTLQRIRSGEAYEATRRQYAENARRIGWVLRVGVSLSSLIVLIGLVLFLTGHGGPDTRDQALGKGIELHRLIFIGFVAIRDPLRTEVKAAMQQCRDAGIDVMMITGDNIDTARAIAKEIGLLDQDNVLALTSAEFNAMSDDEVKDKLPRIKVLARARPLDKLRTVRLLQDLRHVVAVTGDGTNDAPALAQADVAVAMNTGTQAAKEAGNMVDLDSNPTKLIEIVEIGKQMLMTRGSLTTFSIANDVAKYFAIIPAAFATTYPQLRVLDVMHLTSPASAILSAVIFNALIIVALIPLALKGVTYRPLGAASLLRRNLLIYGLGGILLPFPFIKLIDMVLTGFGWA